MEKGVHKYMVAPRREAKMMQIVTPASHLVMEIAGVGHAVHD
jgi:hypothetical protein